MADKYVQDNKKSAERNFSWSFPASALTNSLSAMRDIWHMIYPSSKVNLILPTLLLKPETFGGGCSQIYTAIQQNSVKKPGLIILDLIQYIVIYQNHLWKDAWRMHCDIIIGEGGTQHSLRKQGPVEIFNEIDKLPSELWANSSSKKPKLYFMWCSYLGFSFSTSFLAFVCFHFIKPKAVWTYLYITTKIENKF